MKKLSLIILCIITITSCSTTKKVTQDSGNTSWPDFLRNWATDYELVNAQRMAIIDQIDTLYWLVEDNTSDRELLCSKLCQLKTTLTDAIRNDSSFVFPLMMRATARNFYGKIANNPWLLSLGCDCELTDYLLMDASWYTSSKENFDLMYTTIIGLSWQAPERFANLVLSKEDGNDLAMALLIVYNYIDTAIGNLQLTITDGEGAVMDKITENDTYIDASDICIKRMSLPPYLIMERLAANGTLTISFETPYGIIEMVGIPHIFFNEQIEDCPRLKEVLKQSLK